jgi:probable F420-dependent oxidoreductase
MRNLDQLRSAAVAMERLGFDSLWLSDRISGAAPEPLIALGYLAACTERLKLGTSVLVLPGRNPVLLAKQLASLDVLSRGRLLVALGLGATDPVEQQAFGVASRDRAPWVEEVLPLLRRLWTEDRVDHDGTRFHYRALSVLPRPVQQPIDLWLGGMAPAALRRIGRLGDGWLPSTCAVDELVAGRAIIQQAASEAGRTVDPGHFGVMVVYTRNGIPRALADRVAKRRPDLDVRDVIPSGPTALREAISRFVDAGISKLVLRPAEEPADWAAELEDLASLTRVLQA